MSPSPFPVAPPDTGGEIGLILTLLGALGVFVGVLAREWRSVLRERHRNPAAELKWQQKAHEDCRQRCAELQLRAIQLEREKAEIALRLEKSYQQRIDQLDRLMREQARELGRSEPTKRRGVR